MAHPQGTPRGYKVLGGRLDVGAIQLTANSTALLVSGGVRLNGKAAGLLTANSTGVNFPGTLFVAGQATIGKVDANSTALLLPNSVRIGAKTTYFSSNSTGVKLGTRYVSTNTTGNTTT